MATRIQSEIPNHLQQEAGDVAAELEVSVADLALSAFEGYADGVRVARRGDTDEHSGFTVTDLQGSAGGLDARELEGTEDWLTTESPDGGRPR